MKIRIISAIILSIILIPIVVIGGTLFDITIFIISLFGLNEFFTMKENKKELPFFVKIVSYLIYAFIIFGLNSVSNNIFTIDFRIMSALFLTMLIPTILYHDKNVYSINDAFYLIGGILFLGLAFSAIIYIRSLNISNLIYIALVAMITDAYALFGGYFIGRHKLIPEISPKKTWEGSIVGTLFCILIGSIFYLKFINGNASIINLILITGLLSIIGQFGDLVFSAIKRYFGKKDFSNLIPGHGGILDRFDSIIFVALGFMFFISII